MKMSESEDSSSTNGEDNRSLPRAELAVGVLLSYQNKIKRDNYAKEACEY